MIHDRPKDAGLSIGPLVLNSERESLVFRRTIELYRAHPDHREGVVDTGLWSRCAVQARSEVG